MQSIRDRFKDAPWFDMKGNQYCIVGGAGGISSWLTLFLSRAGFNPTVYDFDVVENINIGGQLYGQHNVGKLKVDALTQNVGMFSDGAISAVGDYYGESSMSHTIMLSGFDNMSARKIMFSNWFKNLNILSDKSTSIFIDGRLLAEQMQVFCIVGNNQEAIVEYTTDHLFSDDDVEDGPCTFKQTTHAAAIIAGLMTGFLTNHITNIVEGRNVRSIPFYTEYFIPINLFTTYDAKH